MILPFSLGTVPLPDWLPWWVPAALLVPLALYAILVLLVPFATFGVKSRLEDIEDQLEELRAEMRALSTRLAPPEEPRSVEDFRSRLAPAPDRRAAGTRAEPRLGPR